MKTRPHNPNHGALFHVQRLTFDLLLALLLANSARSLAQAPAPYTATAWLVDLPAPGIWITNSVGQVGLRGSVHTLRVESADARLTGRRLAFVDGTYQEDGTAIIYGTAYQELGIWNLADSRNPTFTPTGGLWEITYRGTVAPDNSVHVHGIGRGSGGAIEGWRMDEDATRTAESLFDFKVPYRYSGILQPPPASTLQVLNNFDTKPLANWTVYSDGSIGITNQQLHVRGYYPLHTRTLEDSYVVGGRDGKWAIPDGITREWRADLIHLDANDSNYAVLIAGNAYSDDLYGVYVGRNYAFLKKWSPGSGVSIFSCHAVTLPNTNLVLSLALTHLQANLLVTTRVLDKADPSKVFYQHAVMDTPKAEPTLTPDSFQALTGMRLENLGPDSGGPPANFFSVAALGVFQYSDATKPAITAIFDNLELLTYEVPAISAELAVRLRWPLSAAINYSVEGAPTSEGPWLPIQDAPPPGMIQMTVPASDLMHFFRLRQAP